MGLLQQVFGDGARDRQIITHCPLDTWGDIKRLCLQSTGVFYGEFEAEGVGASEAEAVVALGAVI